MVVTSLFTKLKCARKLIPMIGTSPLAIAKFQANVLLDPKFSCSVFVHTFVLAIHWLLLVDNVILQFRVSFSFKKTQRSAPVLSFNYRENQFLFVRML